MPGEKTAARAGCRGGRVRSPARGAGAALLAIGLLCAAGGLAVARAGEAPQKPQPARRVTLSRSVTLNVIDASLYGLAEFYLSEERVEEAVRVIEQVAEKSPDAEARSMSHFNLARVYETTLKDPERARSEYARVTGLFAAAARAKVIGPLRREKRWDEIVAFMKESVDAAEDAETKAEILRYMMGLIRASGDQALIESTLRSVPDLITYEDAQKAAAAERKKRDERIKQAEQRGPRAPQGPAWKYPGGRSPKTPFGRRESLVPTRPKGTRLPGQVTPPARGAGAPTRFGKRPSPYAPGRGGAGKGTTAETEAEIRELERAGFHEKARQLREELHKGKPLPDQF